MMHPNLHFRYMTISGSLEKLLLLGYMHFFKKKNNNLKIYMLPFSLSLFLFCFMWFTNIYTQYKYNQNSKHVKGITNVLSLLKCIKDRAGSNPQPGSQHEKTQLSVKSISGRNCKNNSIRWVTGEGL